ncbi:HAMP domain-containing sensor histidine kinase [Halanaerocella petrolearia]
MLQRLKSIRWKIVTLYLVLLIITLVFSGYFLQQSLENYFSHWLDKKLIGEMELVKGIIKPIIQGRDTLELDKLIDKYGKQLETRITVVNDNGKVLADSREDPTTMDNHLTRPEIQQALYKGLGKKIRYSATLGIDMRYIAIPIKNNGQVIGIIRVALSLNKLNQLYNGIWRVLFQIGVTAFIISIILSFKFTKRITEPIGEMTAVAQRIANGFLDQKLVVKTGDEIGRLAQMFNHMVNQVKNKMGQLSSEKSKIEAIVTSIGDGVIAINEAREIILINLATEQIFGVKEEDVLGQSVIQITKNYKLDELVTEALETGEVLTEEIELLLPEERIFRIRLAPIERESQATGVVASLRDITDIRKLEQMRKEFVSNVSHELKTPLTSIKGYVETLLESDLDIETYNSFLKIIGDETERLEHLINDILDLSKIEAGNNLIEEEIDLVTVINDIIPVLEPKAQQKEVELQLDLPFELPKIQGNQDQLSRLMINLVDNAIKYTPSGGKVEIRGYSENDEIVIEVEDNGIGIPKEDISRIFERFYRVNKARSRKLGGTGLGLSIVKHIVDQHGGEINVESELEQGTKFTVRL